MPVLTALDLIGIQRFVFASNRLRDVVGSSELVAWATSQRGLLGDVVGDGELVVAAGGNAVLRFDDVSAARAFARRCSAALMVEAPGLELVVAHVEHPAGALGTALRQLLVRLADAKTRVRPSAAALGFGVNAVCVATGAAAVGIEDGEPVSAQVQAARRRLDDADERFGAYLASHPRRHFPREVARLGPTPGERSLLGVVHVDGNGVGDLINRWLTRCIDDELADDQVVGEYQAWSQGLAQAADRVMQRLVDRVAAHVKYDGDRYRLRGADEDLDFDLFSDRLRGVALPLRPLLVGGDDVTFICDGRIALDLAALAVEAFREVEVPHLGPVSACAGVAVVSSHSPFVRANEVAVSLTGRAKRAARTAGWRSGAIDWHLGELSSPNRLDASTGQDELRLSCKPYPLHSSDRPLSWRWFADELLGSRGLAAPSWCERRSQAKRLMGEVRAGPQATTRLLEGARARLGELPLPEPIPNGWSGGETPLLDALELMDRAQRLEVS